MKICCISQFVIAQVLQVKVLISIGYCTERSHLKGTVNHLGGGFKHFLFSSLVGEMIQFD